MSVHFTAWKYIYLFFINVFYNNTKSNVELFIFYLFQTKCVFPHYNNICCWIIANLIYNSILMKRERIRGDLRDVRCNNALLCRRRSYNLMCMLKKVHRAANFICLFQNLLKCFTCAYLFFLNILNIFNNPDHHTVTSLMCVCIYMFPVHMLLGH